MADANGNHQVTINPKVKEFTDQIARLISHQETVTAAQKAAAIITN